jgi:AcrR family transcriptional regulator
MGNIKAKKEKKKTALLASAYDLFLSEGYSKTTISDITKNAGVAKGTFYLYFADKDELRDELIIVKSGQLLFDAIDSLTNHIADSGKDLDAADKIIYVIDHIVNYAVNDIPFLNFISNHLSWGLFFRQSPHGDETSEGEVVNFQSFVLSKLEANNIVLEHPKLLIYTVLELINSTLNDVILYGEPAEFDEYKPYLYEQLRLIISNAVISV